MPSIGVVRSGEVEQLASEVDQGGRCQNRWCAVLVRVMVFVQLLMKLRQKTMPVDILHQPESMDIFVDSDTLFPKHTGVSKSVLWNPFVGRYRQNAANTVVGTEVFD